MKTGRYWITYAPFNSTVMFVCATVSASIVVNWQSGVGIHGSIIVTMKFPQVLVGRVPVQVTSFFKVATILTLYEPL